MKISLITTLGKVLPGLPEQSRRLTQAYIYIYIYILLLYLFIYLLLLYKMAFIGLKRRLESRPLL